MKYEVKFQPGGKLSWLIERFPTFALVVGLVLLPIFVHWGAHAAYFEDDDLDTMTWVRLVTAQDVIEGGLTVKFPFQPIRSAGFLFYTLLFHRFGLDYSSWVVALQLFGCLNVLLLWLLLRSLGFGRTSAAMATVFLGGEPGVVRCMVEADVHLRCPLHDVRIGLRHALYQAEVAGQPDLSFSGNSLKGDRRGAAGLAGSL